MRELGCLYRRVCHSRGESEGDCRPVWRGQGSLPETRSNPEAKVPHCKQLPTRLEYPGKVRPRGVGVEQLSWCATQKARPEAEDVPNKQQKELLLLLMELC